MPASRRLRSWPETTWVRLSWRRQRVQVAASSAIRSSSVGIVTSPSSRTDADHPVVQGGGQVRPPEAWRARRNHTVRSVDGYRGDAYAPRRQVVGLRRGRGDFVETRTSSQLAAAGRAGAVGCAHGSGSRSGGAEGRWDRQAGAFGLVQGPALRRRAQPAGGEEPAAGPAGRAPGGP